MQSNMGLGMLMNKKDINTAFICYNYIRIMKNAWFMLLHFELLEQRRTEICVTKGHGTVSE